MTETKQTIEPQPSNWFRKIDSGSSLKGFYLRYIGRRRNAVVIGVDPPD